MNWKIRKLRMISARYDASARKITSGEHLNKFEEYYVSPFKQNRQLVVGADVQGALGGVALMQNIRMGARVAVKVLQRA